MIFKRRGFLFGQYLQRIKVMEKQEWGYTCRTALFFQDNEESCSCDFDDLGKKMDEAVTLQESMDVQRNKNLDVCRMDFDRYWDHESGIDSEDENFMVVEDENNIVEFENNSSDDGEEETHLPQKWRLVEDQLLYGIHTQQFTHSSPSLPFAYSRLKKEKYFATTYVINRGMKNKMLKESYHSKTGEKLCKKDIQYNYLVVILTTLRNLQKYVGRIMHKPTIRIEGDDLGPVYREMMRQNDLQLGGNLDAWLKMMEWSYELDIESEEEQVSERFQQYWNPKFEQLYTYIGNLLEENTSTVLLSQRKFIKTITPIKKRDYMIEDGKSWMKNEMIQGKSFNDIREELIQRYPGLSLKSIYSHKKDIFLRMLTHFQHIYNRGQHRKITIGVRQKGKIFQKAQNSTISQKLLQFQRQLQANRNVSQWTLDDIAQQLSKLLSKNIEKGRRRTSQKSNKPNIKNQQECLSGQQLYSKKCSQH